MRAWRMDWSDTPQTSAISAWVMQPATWSVAVQVRGPWDELARSTVYKKGAAEVVRGLAA